MALETKYGTGARDPAVSFAQPGVNAHATPRKIQSRITISASADVASKYIIGRIPSNAILDPKSMYYFAAIGAGALMDVGFYYPNGGAVIDVDALVDGDDVAAAGSQSLFGHGTITTANMMEPAWQRGGLTVDPGGDFDIVATLAGAAVAGGAVNFFLDYGKSI